MSNIIEIPVIHKVVEEKGRILADLHSAVNMLQVFIVKHGVETFDELDIGFVDDDKNALMVTFETLRRK